LTLVLTCDRTIEKVEEINDEIQDQMMVAEEIGTAIAQPSGSSLVDEDELEAELNALAQEHLEDGLGALDESSLDLPSVPQKGLPVGAKAGAAKQPAADPFDSLQMEMNM
jgi:charged multivesicular body protein 4